MSKSLMKSYGTTEEEKGLMDPENLMDHSYRERSRTESFISNYHSKRIKLFLQTFLVFVLYFFLMLVAFGYTFITVESLVLSYTYPVRSVTYTYKQEFKPPSIIIYPDIDDTFISCDFEVKKNNGDKLLPDYTDVNCSMMEYNYFSHTHNNTRKVLAFKGPARVQLGEKNVFHFQLNLTNRSVSNLEFRVYNTFENFKNEAGRKTPEVFLQEIEENNPVYMLAGDFANFVKLDKTIDQTLNNKIYVTFQVTTNLARLIPGVNNSRSDEVIAEFEWADPILEESQELVSTTVWNTLGSLCAMFLALGKVWLYGKNWIFKIWRTYKRSEKYKRRYTERQEFLKTLEINEELKKEKV
ncbi:putative membrane protein [Oopsacas minuta]|uniref:Proton-activated chloride channel n=1 Tax=Oopsacas minuta TaxID=111878 RepID=A0AAV7JWA9_9METZ|nr:putative membrane protein [Oopsacas minuta]